MGERLKRFKRGLIGSIAALGIMSSSGFLVRDNNISLERAVQEQYERQDIDGLYDYDTECIPNLDETLKSIRQSTYEVRIYMTYIVEGGNNPGLKMAGARGTGLLLKNGLILTASHVPSTKLEDLTDMDSGGVVSFYSADYVIKIEGEEYKLNPVWTDDVWTKDEDFALMEFAEKPEQSLNYYQYEIGNSDKLLNGSVTYTFSAVNDPDIKEGHVINRERGCEWGYSGYENYFFEDTYVAPGDSGGAVIAFLDGKPELVGITCYMHYHTNFERVRVIGGGIFKINMILDEAGEYILGNSNT